MRSRPRLLTVLLRGVRRRCPRCGAAGLFEGWFRMRPACPACGLPTERGEGFWLGGMAINLGLTELVFGTLFVGAVVLTWPDPPWTLLLVLAIALNAVLPILFYPIGKSVFLGIDLLMFRMDPMRGQPRGPYEPDEPPPSRRSP